MVLMLLYRVDLLQVPAPGSETTNQVVTTVQVLRYTNDATQFATWTIQIPCTIFKGGR